ncbi:nucleolar complex protein 3-like protein [Iris pallida]|uniref:Nucleolar complex protein 3-like protein n=1 Tax=Iris pallida TaxID=29817 RepID=A0AAX6GJ86_IRIPA|nr:nucleolar complex protein 3-like protein [Iris pallida]
MGKKKKVILPPELPPDIADEEIEVSDEDFDFVKENKKFAGFLSKIDTKSIDKHVNRVADHKEDELEALYEKRNRKAALKKPKEDDSLQVDRVDVLPIKTLDGKLQYRTARKSSSIEMPNKDAASEVKDNDEDKSLVRLTKPERRLQLKKSRKEAKKQAKEEVKEDTAEGSLHSEVLAKVEEDLSAELFARKKIRLAGIGMALIENPESSIKSLKELLQICYDEDHNIVKLGLMSLLAVFKDIIPGYRIRLPTEKELEMTVSKAVGQTRFYESTLLHSYKDYLLRLMALEKQPLYHRVAVRCLCNLLDAVPHFNFRPSLLAGVVKNISSSDDIVRKLCCEAIKSLFANEGKHGGEATLEAVRLIADQVKYHDCQLHPDSLNVFLSLTFDEDLGKSEPKEIEKDRFKKKRNWKKHEESNQLKGSDAKKSRQELLAKTREEVSADFKAVSFAPDTSERRRMQSDTLSAVFETYFRILKRSMDLSVSRLKPTSLPLSGGFGTHPLLAPCLNGLGKFSHLIDLDFMGDLMMCLKRLAGYSENDDGPLQNCLSVSERFQCCIVAFRVMRNNLDALNVDLQEFFVQLYNLMLEYRPGRDHGDVLAEALKTMLWEGKQHDMQRAAAFIKRLATFALSFGSTEAIAALVTLKHLLQKNSKCRCLLENDAGGGSLSGLVVNYQPDASDPNLSGALASVLWELNLLSRHYNPTISSMASSISSMATMNPSQNQSHLSTTSPVQAFRDLSIEQELSMPISKPSSTQNRKRKGEKPVDVASRPERIWETGCKVHEDEVKNKLENHFKVLRDIEENERLRAELNRTLKSISIYEEYKQKKKLKKGSSVGKESKSRENFVMTVC